MKQIFLVLLVMISMAAAAQNKSKRPCMPDNGYWVIESNIHTPRQSTVHFYSANHVLIHSEEITGRKLNVRRKKVVASLNAALDQSLLAWKKGEAPATALLQTKRR